MSESWLVLKSARVAIAFSLFVGATAQAVVVSVGEYPFPYQDPNQSTLITELLKSAPSYTYGTGNLTDLEPNRHAVPYAEGRDQLPYEFHIASPDAPLVFILAGLGGYENSGISRFIADRLAREGYSSISISSPYYWRFALVASASTVPGIASDDCQELYSEMQTILNLLKTQHQINPRKFGFVGYSMGGFEGERIAEIDKESGKLGISAFLLINPPLDLDYGIQVLDEMYGTGLKLGEAHIDQIMEVLMDRGLPLLGGDIDSPGYFVGLQQKIGLTDDEVKYAISENLEIVAPDLVNISQSFHQTLPDSEFPVPTNTANRQVRESRANRFMLGDYMRRIVLPMFAAETGLQADSPEFALRMRPELLMSAHLDQIIADPRIHIMHNADDFITAKADLDALEAAVPDRVTVYPFGGHVENIWFPQNQTEMLKVFQDLKN
jgi:predicted alpha/beta-fold hydrolase